MLYVVFVYASCDILYGYWRCHLYREFSRMPRPSHGYVWYIIQCFWEVGSICTLLHLHLHRLSLDSPYLRTTIPTTRDKVFIDKPHFLRRFRMPIDDHTRMCMCRSIVVFNSIFTSASNDFT